ncbi:MAG: TRAP transporter small permease subunit [Pseudomonadota bacterium]
MPGLSFTLPHLAYLAGLVLFPIIAMVLARRPRQGPARYTTPLAYLILVTGGMIGLHRLYVKNLWGLAFIPIFGLILYANAMGSDARTALSDASNAQRVAERTLERERPRVTEAEAELDALRAAVAEAEAEEGSFALRSAERRLSRAEGRIETGRERIAQAEAELAAALPMVAAASAERAFWTGLARNAFYALLALMALDALLLPLLVRGANVRISETAATVEDRRLRALEEAERKADEEHVSTGATGLIDRISLYAGEFVAYWAVIAVFVYYYEVIARYVFNSPTNWAHEAMYLMFGMQYLIAGSYAMLTQAHVRVDIFYAPLRRSQKAWVDLLTSVFFFIFAGTLLVTSFIFAWDAITVPSGNGLISQWARGQISSEALVAQFSWAQFIDPAIRWGEISFNEWEVPLWPMKWMMVLGAVLLILQGLSKLARDVQTVFAER